jgi:hypothetical protein
LKNVLLASLGAGNLKETTYQFNDATHTTKFCCLGLARLLDVKFDCLYLLLTEEARRACESELRKEATDSGAEVCIIEINSGKTIEEIWQMFDQITDSFDQSEETNIFLDISNGFRHLPLLSFASLTYLESSRKVKLAGVYYGAWEARSAENIAPVFDLTPLVNIVKGSYSVKAFDETGAIEPLGEFLNALLRLRKNDKDKLMAKLRCLHGSISSGLPLESGRDANDLNAWVSRNLPAENLLLAAKSLLARLQSKISKIKINGKFNKQCFVLDKTELARELELIKWHAGNNNHSTAVILAREWVISRIWVAESPDGYWLDKNDRFSLIENELGYWSDKIKNPSFRDRHYEKPYFDLLALWSELTEIRNQFAHAGFQIKPVNFERGREKLDKFFTLVDVNINNDAIWRLPRRETDERKVLITGMGASFGLLYSAVHHIQPDSVIVITSGKYHENAIDACKRAGFISDTSINVVEMHDVFCGFAETPGLIKTVWPLMQHAECLVVNLTGGTTAMQWVMQSLYEKARAEHVPVERVAFVDRRPAVEQQQNPWHLGELVEIEKITMKPERKSE